MCYNAPDYKVGAVDSLIPGDTVTIGEVIRGGISSTSVYGKVTASSKNGAIGKYVSLKSPNLKKLINSDDEDFFKYTF